MKFQNRDHLETAELIKLPEIPSTTQFWMEEIDSVLNDWRSLQIYHLGSESVYLKDLVNLYSPSPERHMGLLQSAASTYASIFLSENQSYPINDEKKVEKIISLSSIIREFCPKDKKVIGLFTKMVTQHYQKKMAEDTLWQDSHTNRILAHSIFMVKEYLPKNYEYNASNEEFENQEEFYSTLEELLDYPGDHLANTTMLLMEINYPVNYTQNKVANIVTDLDTVHCTAILFQDNTEKLTDFYNIIPSGNTYLMERFSNECALMGIPDTVFERKNLSGLNNG